MMPVMVKEADLDRIDVPEHRSARFLGVALLLGGAFTVIDGLIRLLSGASP